MPYLLQPNSVDATSTSFGNLTIEDAGDHVSVSGDLDIHRDLEGLRIAIELADHFADIRDALQKQAATLPKRAPIREKSFVKNPLSP